MRNPIHHFLLLVLLLAAACRREPQPEAEVPLRFADVSVRIGVDDGDGAPDTRSLITIDAERFQDAYLFAFDAATKKVLAYPEHAGDLEGSGPVAIHTTSKTFDWALPVAKAMDIWVVVNAGASLRGFLNAALANAGLSEADLYGTKMTFSCSSGTQLKALDADGAGIPMAGRMDGVSLASANATLSVKVRRLFAKYNIHFDTSAYTSRGYDVKSTYLMASKSNTEVPFFWDGGYRQTDYAKLATVDRSTEDDLITLDGGGQVTLYFLENCQGDKSGARSWRTVYGDLGPEAVKLCSYMEIGVNVTRVSDGADRSFFHRIYLGNSDMKSNFDVERNLFKTIRLSLSPDADEGEPAEAGLFVFTSGDSPSVSPGQTVTIPFETTFSSSELEFMVSRNGGPTSDLQYESHTCSAKTASGSYRYASCPNAGTVTLRASSGADEGTVDVTGGIGLNRDEGRVACTVPVAIQKSVDLYQLVIPNSPPALTVGTTFQFVALLTPLVGGSTPTVVTQTASWSISPSSTATVKAGLVSATQAGTYTVTASAAGPDGRTYSASATIVYNAPASETTYALEISGASTVTVSSTTQLKASFKKYVDGKEDASFTTDVTQSCTWSSASTACNPNYTNKKGLFWSNATGMGGVRFEVKATYTYGGKEYSATHYVTVEPFSKEVRVTMIYTSLGDTSCSWHVELSESVPFDVTVTEKGTGDKVVLTAGNTVSGTVTSKTKIPSIFGCTPVLTFSGNTTYRLVW